MEKGHFNPLELIDNEIEKMDIWKYLALHHELTKLPNRRMLHMSMESYLRMAREKNTGLAVVIIDLDKFKKINDTFGHLTGDALLIDVASRLSTLVVYGIHAFHISGDEFVLLIEQADQLDGKLMLINGIFDKPFCIENKQLHIGASLGISLFPEHSQNANVLLEYADRAMYKAKSSINNRCILYEDD
ncbi:diguanylate cyclase domain-containing protein [Ureibacillus sp. GCM10028918]|uniref:diguanylate cyclase domain-containing protein n=1 Tax=Ureibacillus sp. GCM10028918 TaxID=3273429 RepID=UPI0036132DEF